MIINITEYLERSAGLYPDKIAISDTLVSYTFSFLKYRSKIIAQYILKSKKLNSPIAVFMQKNCDAIISFAAINYSGNFYVPIDVKQPKMRIKNIFNTLSPEIVLTNTLWLETLKSLYNGTIICIDDLKNEIVNESVASNVLDNMIDTDPVYAIFTSGSTGDPKGVVISHRGVIDYIEWALDTFGVNETTIIANQAPFYFDNSTLDIYLMFATGATLIIVPEEYYSFPVKLIALLNETKTNFVFWVPSVLVNIANMNLLENAKPEYLEKILFAGEVMPNKYLNYWRKYLPACLYANLYGPTEITVDCVYYIVDRLFLDEEPLPIGKPCRNSGILILNEKDELVMANEPGELCVRGTSLALGYYNNLPKTVQVFVQNPLNRHYPETIYRTGDIVYRNNHGEIIYVGRKDSQIKHSGYRIEPGEIENAALATNLVQTNCVIYNDQRKEIVMFYENNIEIDLKLLRKKLLNFIPKYMLPSKYVRLEKMPYNANGKIDRVLLKGQISQYYE
jgi:amino acid adenylation domain-containing protein